MNYTNELLMKGIQEMWRNIKRKHLGKRQEIYKNIVDMLRELQKFGEGKLSIFYEYI